MLHHAIDVKGLRGAAPLVVLVLLTKGCGGDATTGPTAPSVAARRWLGAQLIGSGEIGADSLGVLRDVQPVVAVDSSGAGVALWTESGGSRRVRASRFTPGRGWSGAEAIDVVTDEGPDDVRVSMVSSGQAVALWRQSDGTRARIWSNRLEPSRGWGTPETIDGGGNTSGPDVALSGPNEGWAVWSSRDAIWARRLSAGNWAEAIRLGVDISGLGVAAPRVAASVAGVAVALWGQFYPSNRGAVEVWATSFLPSRGWAAPQAISGVPWFINRPDVVIDATGRAVALWPQLIAITTLWSSHFLPETGWIRAQQVPANSSSLARIALDPRGALGAWVYSRSDEAQTSRRVTLSRYSMSTGWSQVQDISIPSLVRGLDLATDSQGNAIVVWNQSTTGDELSTYAVWARRLGADGVLEASGARLQAENSWSASPSSEPRVEMTPSGDAIVVWREFEGLQFRVWANRYAAAP